MTDKTYTEDEIREADKRCRERLGLAGTVPIGTLIDELNKPEQTFQDGEVVAIHYEDEEGRGARNYVMYDLSYARHTCRPLKISELPGYVHTFASDVLNAVESMGMTYEAYDYLSEALAAYHKAGGEG